MARRPIEIRITAENISTELQKGDVIVEAEMLGTVVSARPTIHNNGTAFIYFMGGDCYRETFAIPMTITVLRDPEWSEHEWTGRPLGTHVMVEISKAGGGTVGRRYTGDWPVRITRNGKVICDDVMRVTSRSLTHEEAAREAYCFVDDAYAADYREG